MNEHTTEQQKPQLPTQVSDAYLADFTKERRGNEETGLTVLLMTYNPQLLQINKNK